MYNANLSELLKRPWAIDPQTAALWLPTVANILKGKSSLNDFQQEKADAVSGTRYVVDDEGNQISGRELSEIPSGSVGIVRIAGPMIKYGNWCAYGSDELVSFAEEFESNNNVIGQIWLIDTGGGSVDAVAPYHDFLSRKTKPVYAVADMCASAGMWVAASCDRLFAENTISSCFGSIGVMATLYDFRERLKEMGVTEHVIYSLLSTHKNKSYHDALDGNYEGFQKEHLDPLAEKFIAHIKKNRPSLNQDVEGILSGKMFYAEEAKKHGLIDGVSNLSQAIETLRTRAMAQEFIYQ